VINCVSYEFNSIYFTNPKSWVSWALIELHDYMMFFLLNILIIVLVFSYVSLTYQQIFYKNKSTFLPYLKMNLRRFNHAPFLEFFWTFIPIILLFAMGWPSFKILYAIEQLVDPYHTVIIVGNQWYWTYQYSDFDTVSEIIRQLDDSKKLVKFKNTFFKLELIKNFLVTKDELNNNFDDKNFLQMLAKSLRKFDESKLMYDSVIISDENLPYGYPRMLSVDQVLILPSGVSVRLLVTSSDVIHSWAMPAFGYKMDAIPGRINQIAFIVPFWGTYWGQCSELCGINHGFMPIEVKVLSYNDYLSFIKLNFSFKFDLFWPLVKKFYYKYVNYRCFNIEKDKFGTYSDLSGSNKIISKNIIGFYLFKKISFVN